MLREYEFFAFVLYTLFVQLNEPTPIAEQKTYIYHRAQEWDYWYYVL